MNAPAWFVTGTSSGIGRELVRELLGRGHRVAATGLDVAALDDLALQAGDPLWRAELDVTQLEQIESVVDRAWRALGRIDVVVDPFLSVIPYVKAGRMKMIATLGDQRVPGYGYPIASETVKGFSVTGLAGFVAAAGTPKAVVAKIQADTARVLADPETRKRIEDLGMEVVTTKPEQFDALIQSEMKRWARVITEARIEQE